MAKTYGHPNAQSHDQLRHRAKSLLNSGTAPSSGEGSLSVEALEMLYQQASRPESAADALRLLHELQTYQVELDLLYEQLHTNEQELTEELAFYKSLYQLAPAAYLIVSGQGEVMDANQAANALFGETAWPLIGKELGNLVAPGQAGIVSALLEAAAGQTDATPVTANREVDLADQRRLSINARPTDHGNTVLVILTEATTPSIAS